MQTISNSKKMGLLNRINKRTRESSLFIVVFAAILVAFHLLSRGGFLTYHNIIVVLSHTTLPTLIGLGLCFIFTTGIIDLSIGAIIILAANIGGICAVRIGYPGLFIGSVASALLMVLLNIKIVQTFKIPSWIVGLGMAMVYEAIALFYSVRKINQGGRVVELGTRYRELGLMPYILIVGLLSVALAYYLYNRTTIGINIRAIGGNAKIAEMMGINVKRTTILGGVLGGIFVGLASTVNESYAGVIVPISGLGSLTTIFQPLAVFFLAQALANIIDLTLGIFLSAVLVASVFNFLTKMGVPSGTWQEIVLGLSIVAFGIFAQRKYKGVAK